MRCLTAILTVLLMTSAAKADRVKFCFLFCAVESPAAVDSFCTSYSRVIRNPSDAAAVKGLPRNLRERNAANDTLYRCTCEGWKHKACVN